MPVAAACVAAVLALALTSCSADTRDDSGPRSASSTNPAATSDSASPDAGSAYQDALSRPEEDSVYPDVGDPSVDALHYALDIAWDPTTRTLTGKEQLVFRATATADHVQLDLEPQLTVSAVQVDGQDALTDHPGKDLVVHGDFTADQDYTLTLDYAGKPAPVQAPTTRSDFSTTGFTVDGDGSAWTMQEPYGAYTWYAVNDQPADKAFYDFTLRVPDPWTGVANGTMTDRTVTDGTAVSTWHLDSKVSSYLVTVAFGDYATRKDTSGSGVPISYWVPKGAPAKYQQALRYTPEALDWVESKLGPYPWSSLGMLLVHSNSGMETQTMITLGDTDYTTEKDTIVHEIVHQWYGDEVTPDDWRDLWMSEGMAMYLQFEWQSEHTGEPIGSILQRAVAYERYSRSVNGPPGAYDPKTFGEIQVYYGPALMWDEIRRKVGDDAFWAMVKAWPAVAAKHDDGSAGRAAYLPWVEQQTGADLGHLFHAWLLGKRSPRFH